MRFGYLFEEAAKKFFAEEIGEGTFQGLDFRSEDEVYIIYTKFSSADPPVSTIHDVLWPNGPAVYESIYRGLRAL